MLNAAFKAFFILLYLIFLRQRLFIKGKHNTQL